MAESIFKLKAPFKPTGDQPEAVQALLDALKRGENRVVLKGVTGSGKTFTLANLIEKWSRPVLILSHNKTLAAQLFTELKGFFPDNAVEYFISYYDYYQPEAYIPRPILTSKKTPLLTKKSSATAFLPRTPSSVAAMLLSSLP